MRGLEEEAGLEWGTLRKNQSAEELAGVVKSRAFSTTGKFDVSLGYMKPCLKLKN